MEFLIELFSKVVPVLVTAVLGTVGAIIAIQQYRLSRRQLELSQHQHILAKDKLRFELFDKRREAYDKLADYFSEALREGRVNEKTFALLWQAKLKSRFLFGADIDEFLESLWENGVLLTGLHRQLHGEDDERLPVGSERTAAAGEHRDKFLWLTKQMTGAILLFGKYLKFDLGE